MGTWDSGGGGAASDLGVKQGVKYELTLDMELAEEEVDDEADGVMDPNVPTLPGLHTLDTPIWQPIAPPMTPVMPPVPIGPAPRAPRLPDKPRLAAPTPRFPMGVKVPAEQAVLAVYGVCGAPNGVKAMLPDMGAKGR